MIKTLKRLRNTIHTMTQLQSCCVLTSGLVLLLISILTVDFVYAVEQNMVTSTTAAPPFMESTMFVGLAAGIGGFLGFAILCCILWKCCCGSKE